MTLWSEFLPQSERASGKKLRKLACIVTTRLLAIKGVDKIR